MGGPIGQCDFVSRFCPKEPFIDAGYIGYGLDGIMRTCGKAFDTYNGDVMGCADSHKFRFSFNNMTEVLLNLNREEEEVPGKTFPRSRTCPHEYPETQEVEVDEVSVGNAPQQVTQF